MRYNIGFSNWNVLMKRQNILYPQASNVGLRFVGDIERGKPTIQFDKLMAVLTSLGIAVKMELP